MKSFLILACACATTTACTRTDSQDVTTRGIYAAMSASTEGTGTTTVSATLYFGNPGSLDFVELTGDDRLLASFGSQTKVMSESSLLNIVSHVSTFDTDAEGDQFVVDFERTIDAGAPTSTATLPAAFTLAPGPTTASRAAPLEISFAPLTTDPVDWVITGPCIETTTRSAAPTDGVIVVAPGTITLTPNATLTTCDVTITVTRQRDGELDPGFGKGGQIFGAQVRSLTFSSTP